jgi:hypothetical protein
MNSLALYKAPKLITVFTKAWDWFTHVGVSEPYGTQRERERERERER